MEVTSKYCQACLSGNRNLHPLANLLETLENISLWELIQVEGGICWECLSLVNKFVRFKANILKSQETLQQLDKNNKVLKSFSHLKAELNSSYEYNFCFNNENENPSEPDNKTIKIEEQTGDGNQAENDNEQKVQYSFNEFPIEIKFEVDEESTKSDGYQEDILEKEPDINIGNKSEIKEIEREKEMERIAAKSKELTLFTKVVFTEEEMLKNRKDKENHPNYKKMPLKCDSCVLGFTRKDTYEVHMRSRHDKIAGDNVCSVCQARYSTKGRLQRHKEKHYICYRCKLCKYGTVEMQFAYSHARNKHRADDIENIHCRNCDFVAKSLEELTEHTSSKHSIVCNDCGEKFKSKDSLRSHIKRIHKVKREFKCDLCNKAFLTRFRLESHLVKHNSTLAQKLAYCAQCNVQYKNIFVYRSHLRTSAEHALEGHECEVCHKKFASKAYMKQHYNFYHLKKSPFKCEPCNKIFLSDFRLRNHRQARHGLSRSRDHPCSACGKMFYTVKDMQNHMLTHSSERKFMCAHCGDTFKQRAALYTHCKLVHKEGKPKTKKLK